MHKKIARRNEWILMKNVVEIDLVRN